MSQNNKNNMAAEDEIDLLALAKTLWLGRKTIIITMIIFMILGLFVAVFSEKEYTASTTFIPQDGESSIGGGLGGLAAMAGINLGSMSSGSEITPSLYPQIVYSIPFQLELLKTPLTIEGETKKITYEEYYSNIYRPSILGYIKKYTIGLPGLLISVIKGKPKSADLYKPERSLEGEFAKPSLLFISEEQQKLIDRLSKQLFLEVNEDDGYIYISGNMTEAIASAELVYRAEVLLQEFIIELKSRKSKEKLAFIKERYQSIEEKFIVIQLKLANFEDKNKFVNSSMSRIKLQSLQDEYNLVYSVYTELANQLEAQYIQVSEDTPVFTILQPVNIPLERSKPKRLFILIFWVFLGGGVGVSILFGKEKIRKLNVDWKYFS
ncbi:Wzz/FepE/Etk N-terminal domain-containing protein [Flavicella sp.]|uniref:Wzz/FepE/Etk N-terminal domain-containing protein n=1 Tax=Flavicella sp. TaxID=2957742 RepID=UPI003019CC96